MYFVAACACILLPFETSHLLAAISGAATFILYEKMKPSIGTEDLKECNLRQERAQERRERQHTISSQSVTKQSFKCGSNDKQKPIASQLDLQKSVHRCVDTLTSDVCEQNVVASKAPAFTSLDWEGEVEEWLLQISPTPHCNAAVQRVVQVVKQHLWKLVPGADVVAYATGNVTAVTAFGVAVPDIDIIIKSSAEQMLARKRRQMQSSSKSRVSIVEAARPEKALIRSCTQRLVSDAGFKYRRSTFSSAEPKVTRLVPGEICDCVRSLPVSMSVNTTIPMHNAVLLAECGRMDARIKELALLVRRWAKDRGICNRLKGHSSPYAWTLLVIFFWPSRNRWCGSHSSTIGRTHGFL